jgi:hypothetical protein
LPPPAHRIEPVDLVATRLADAAERRRTAVYAPR